MNHKNLIKIFSIILFVGIILILTSWIYSYPIQHSSIQEKTIFQFFPSLWPGIIFCSIGLFFLGYYKKGKGIQALCSAAFPIIIYVFTFFFSYAPSSDSGSVRAMFYVFQKTGINSEIIPYFEFPSIFTFNEIIHLLLQTDESGTAVLSIIFYGLLLGLFLYLFLDDQRNRFNKQLMPFILVFTYFLGMYSFLNFQWAPQTLALVYFFILLFLTSKLIGDHRHKFWEFTLFIFFIAFFFTHAILPIIFLLFFAIVIIKKRNLTFTFVILTSFLLVFTLYYLNVHFNIYVQTFQQSISGFGNEYVSVVSRSLGSTTTFLNSIISMVNRFRIPFIWLLSFIGVIILFFRKKMHSFFISLGFAGGLYLMIGALFSILGMRATQIFFIPVSSGITYFFTKWKKISIIIFTLLLILSVFGPMRIAYNNTQFHTHEEVISCDFLATNINDDSINHIALSQSNNGYYKTIYRYLYGNYPVSIRPGNSKFLDIFKENMTKNQFIIYNSNLAKEILVYRYNEQQLSDVLPTIQQNNKIIDNGITTILKGNIV